MAIYKFRNVGGFGTYQRYNDFLAGNPAVQLDKGSMFPLGVFTLATAASNVEFTNIPQTYTHLQIRGMNIFSAADQAIAVQVNGDTNSNYRWHRLYGNGASALSDASASTTLMYLTFGSNTTNQESPFIIDILDYKNTNKNKTFRGLSGSDRNGATGYVGLCSGLWINSNAITSLKLYPASGNFNANSSFALYGVNA